MSRVDYIIEDHVTGQRVSVEMEACARLLADGKIAPCYSHHEGQKHNEKYYHLATGVKWDDLEGWV